MDKFIVLDALRGAAAFSVITRHASGFFSYHLHYSYLAVDLFFILSGFVITHAYDKKLLTGELTVKKFVITRIIRLYPLYFVSVFLGAIAFFPWGKLVSGGELDQSPYILSFLAALMFLPYKMPNDNSLYPLVGVCWSLFYEIIINVFYAYFCNRLNKITSSLIVLILGISLLIVGLHSNSIDGGYSWGGASVILGLLRSSYGFLLGMLIYRSKNFRYNIARTFRFLFAVLPLIVLFSPKYRIDDVYIEIICLSIVFPLGIYFGSKLDVKSTKVSYYFGMLGVISYPLYLFHAPLASIFIKVMRYVHIDMKNITIFSGVCLCLLLVAMAVTLDRVYDAPIRTWLRKLLIK